MVSWWEGWWELLGGRAAAGARGHRGVAPPGLPRRLRGRHRRRRLHLRVGAGRRAGAAGGASATRCSRQGAMINAVVAQPGPPRHLRHRPHGPRAERGVGAGVRRRVARLVAHPRRHGATGRAGHGGVAQHEQARHLRDRHRRRLLHRGVGAGLRRLAGTAGGASTARRSRRARTSAPCAAAPTTSTSSRPTPAARCSPRRGSRRSPTGGTAGGTSRAAWDGRARRSAPVSRSTNKLDIFVVGHRQHHLHGGVGAGVRRRLARLVESQRRQGRSRDSRDGGVSGGLTSWTSS